MNVLAIDTGGTNIKILATGEKEPRKFPSGPTLSPQQMVERGLKRLGKKKWRKHVAFGVNRLTSALQVNDVVVGGGNAKNLKKLPPGCRTGNNAYAFVGGFRMWETGETKPAPGGDASRRK